MTWGACEACGRRVWSGDRAEGGRPGLCSPVVVGEQTAGAVGSELAAAGVRGRPQTPRPLP